MRSPGASPAVFSPFGRSPPPPPRSSPGLNSSQRPGPFDSSLIRQLWPPAWPHRRSMFPFTGAGCPCQSSPLPPCASFSRCHSLRPRVSCQFLTPSRKGAGGREPESMGSFHFRTSVNSTHRFSEFRLRDSHPCRSPHPALNPAENASCYLRQTKNVALSSRFERAPEHRPERAARHRRGPNTKLCHLPCDAAP